MIIKGLDAVIARLASSTLRGQKIQSVDVGYECEYALYVHEDLTKAHGEVFNTKYADEIQVGREHPRRPQEQAKFLEQPMRVHRQEILDIIAKNIKNKEGLRVALTRAGNFLLTKSNELVPIDTGKLIASGYVRVA